MTHAETLTAAKKTVYRLIIRNGQTLGLAIYNAAAIHNVERADLDSIVRRKLNVSIGFGE